MTVYRREFRVPRLRALRRILSRRGLVLAVQIEGDGSWIATVDDSPQPRAKPRWHAPDEEWKP